MPDTTNRPTPEQIADAIGQQMTSRAAIAQFVARLTAAGYVIVHPDDVPALDDVPFDGNTTDPDVLVRYASAVAWNRCRAHIFGDDQ